MDVTVLCCGVPVGTAPLIFRTEPTGQLGLRIGPARHLPAYDGLIGRALRAYKEAKALWTRLPYPEAVKAQAQMAETWTALAELWSTLELCDDTGSVLPIPVERFSERIVSGRFDELPGRVLAQIHERYVRAQESAPLDA